MKHTIYILLLLITVGFTQCCKEKPTTNTDVPGLPPATQTGANTLGFLLNGVPWVPEGNNGTANLSIDFDPGINNGYLSIAAYNYKNSKQSYVIVAIQDSLNFAIPPITYRVGTLFNGFLLYSDTAFCERRTNDLLTYSNGYITINKIDRIIGFVAGTFECTVFNPSCGDTIKITNGRFDMKF
jgi:hypothetical protein